MEILTYISLKKENGEKKLFENFSFENDSIGITLHLKEFDELDKDYPLTLEFTHYNENYLILNKTKILTNFYSSSFYNSIQNKEYILGNLLEETSNLLKTNKNLFFRTVYGKNFETFNPLEITDMHIKYFNEDSIFTLEHCNNNQCDFNGEKEFIIPEDTNGGILFKNIKDTNSLEKILSFDDISFYLKDKVIYTNKPYLDSKVKNYTVGNETIDIYSNGKDFFFNKDKVYLKLIDNSVCNELNIEDDLKKACTHNKGNFLFNLSLAEEIGIYNSTDDNYNSKFLLIKKVFELDDNQEIGVNFEDYELNIYNVNISSKNIEFNTEDMISSLTYDASF